MLLLLKPDCKVRDIAEILQMTRQLNLKPQIRREKERVVIGLVGDGNMQEELFRSLPVVEKVFPLKTNYKLSSREFHSENTQIVINGCRLGGTDFGVMAGPCAVENQAMLFEIAGFLKELGIKILRGGAFKPRSSPYSYQGLKEVGLRYLEEVKKKFGLAIITELVAIEHLPEVSAVADVIQIGARNMQNFALLERLGSVDKPVLLKRGMNSTLEELLMAADYIIYNGNNRVLLCERGIRTFEKFTRNTFDLAAIPLLKNLSHLPVIADPSHGTGVRAIVSAVAKAATVAGADGLLIEVHPQPEKALSDGYQTLDFAQFKKMFKELKKLCRLSGKIL